MNFYAVLPLADCLIIYNNNNNNNLGNIMIWISFIILSTLAAAMEHKGLTYRCADLQKHDQLISKLPAFFSFFFFFSTTSAIRQTYDLKHLTFLRIFKGVVDTKLKMIIYVINGSKLVWLFHLQITFISSFILWNVPIVFI